MASTFHIRHKFWIFILGGAIAGCGGGGGSPVGNSDQGGEPGQPASSVTNTYGTTSSHGDFATWTISGVDVRAVWQKINLTGTVAATFTIQAICGSASATNGERACGITASTTDVAGIPPPKIGNTFKIVEAVGSALFVYTAADADTGMPSQLHIGVMHDSVGCNVDLSGEYLYTHIGPGSKSLFGLYRVDKNFEAINHADFGMHGGSLAEAQLHYLTDYGTSTGEELILNLGCEAGVQRVTFNGDEDRVLRTKTGTLILDMAAGQGGNIAFDRRQAAPLEDFANKRFTALSFSDDPAHPYDLATLNSGSVVTGDDSHFIDLSGIGIKESSMSARIEPISDRAIQAKFLPPESYLLNSALAQNVPEPRNVPGIYQVTRNPGEGGVILIAMKGANGKVVAFGSVYAPREVDCDADNSPPTQLLNAGSFVLIER